MQIYWIIAALVAITVLALAAKPLLTFLRRRSTMTKHARAALRMPGPAFERSSLSRKFRMAHSWVGRSFARRSARRHRPCRATSSRSIARAPATCVSVRTFTTWRFAMRRGSVEACAWIATSMRALHTMSGTA